MANFKTTIITKKGHALMAKLSANVATMKFTKVCSSDFDYSNLNNSELEQVITFKNLKQTVLPDLITVVNTTTVKVSATITNTNLSEGYYLRTIGLFALDPDDGEILYSITPTTEADYMAADNGITKSGISLDLLTTISNSENVSLEVDPNAMISAETFNNVVGNVSDLENGGTNLVDGINKNTARLKEKANKNTEELVYYVSKNGNDNNDGLSADKPFLTINKAISKIPNFIANNITINIADGTYNEEINIEGKNGGSIITIKGNTSTPSNVTINNARVRSCTCLVVIDGFKAITTAKTSFIGSNSTYVDFSHCISNVSASIIGLQATMSNVILRNSEISNKTSYGILSEYNSNLISIGNTGTTNNTALLATYGGTISKSGTQPSGTISESSINGGAIR